MALNISGGGGLVVEAKAEAAGNTLKVSTSAVDNEAGKACLVLETDIGTIVGRQVRAPETTQDYRIRMGMDTLLFSEQFPGAVLNSGLWTAPTATMTVTVTGGYLNLNAGGSVATTVSARVQTYRSFPLFGLSPACVKMIVQFTQTPQTGNVCEWGFGIAAGVAAPNDGAFFRLNSSGNLVCVVSFNGTETVSATINFAAYVGTTTAREYQVIVTENKCEFFIDDLMVANIMRATAQAAGVSAASQPILLRNYNSAATSAAQIMKVGLVAVQMMDCAAPLPPGDTLSAAGQMGSQGQTGATMGSTANFANNTNPTAAVPTNTTAALGTGNGGQFWETDTLAAANDGIIDSYQVPPGTATTPGKTLMVRGVRIDSFVQTVLGVGGYNAVWSLAYGHTTVSLQTAEAATTKAPRRVPLGSQSVASSALALTQLATIDVKFNAPIAVNAGEFLAIVKKKVGTASASGTIAHTIFIDSYWI